MDITPLASADRALDAPTSEGIFIVASKSDSMGPYRQNRYSCEGDKNIFTFHLQAKAIPPPGDTKNVIVVRIWD